MDSYQLAIGLIVVFLILAAMQKHMSKDGRHWWYRQDNSCDMSKKPSCPNTVCENGEWVCKCPNKKKPNCDKDGLKCDQNGNWKCSTCGGKKMPTDGSDCHCHGHGKHHEWRCVEPNQPSDPTDSKSVEEVIFHLAQEWGQDDERKGFLKYALTFSSALPLTSYQLFSHPVPNSMNERISIIKGWLASMTVGQRKSVVADYQAFKATLLKHNFSDHDATDQAAAYALLHHEFQGLLNPY